MAISSTKLPYQNQNKNSSTHQINLSQIDFYPSIPESLKIEANWNLHSPPPSFKPITGLVPKTLIFLRLRDRLTQSGSVTSFSLMVPQIDLLCELVPLIQTFNRCALIPIEGYQPLIREFPALVVDGFTQNKNQQLAI
ncbi:hypothetical protein R6Q59_026840 [Mikania micrantha]